MGQTTLVFDIETDGLIPEMTTIHSLVIRDTDSGETYSCTDHWAHYEPPEGIRVATIEEGLEMLEEAGTVVGHNIVDFDIPAIQKLYPTFKPRGLVRDTIIMSRLMWADMTDADFRMEKKRGQGRWIERKMFGRHSLESWGQRLGNWKGDYGALRKDEGKKRGLKGEDLTRFVWGTWSQAMQDYCVQDVEVTDLLWRKVQTKGFSEESISLEHAVRRIVSRQERYGFLFDEAAAVSLYGVLAEEKTLLERQLAEVFQPWYRSVGKKVPSIKRRVSQKQFKPLGYKVKKKTGEQVPIYPKCEYSPDAPYTDIKLVPFNPGSRFDIADRLKKLRGWRPLEFTSDGHPKVDEEVLNALPYPEARLLTRYLLIQKRIGQLADGKEAWLKNVKNDGRIHGSVNTNGTVTGRMTHSRPNMAQVPSSGAPFGPECRALFVVPGGKLLVGADADALELRDLAGYMARYDGGAYIKVVLEGKKEDGTDMHTQNAKALGCDRSTAKVWFYAFIYGAGDYKLGTILGAAGSKQQVIAAGKTSRAKFLANLPALKKLSDAVKAKAAKQGWIKGLDGRILMVRSQHSALNTLLQSAGAIQMKRALVILDDNLQAAGLVPGVNYEFVGNIHDEWQIEVDEDKAELVGKMATEAISLAGEYYNFRCQLAGNYDVGRSWADTH